MDEVVTDRIPGARTSPTPASKKATAPAREKKRDLSATDIADKLYSAILERQIRPGTKLAEIRLAGIFSVNRARIRDALSRLAHEKVVELVPHQGAYVARPTVQEARDVFEARQLIEPFVVQKLCCSLSPAKIKQLRAHLTEEALARSAQDERKIIRLSGEFHILLAEIAENSQLLRAVRDLSTQTCLIISLYSTSTALSCRDDEHVNIVDAIIGQDVMRATELISQHLDHIQNSLNLDTSLDGVDLESIFSEPHNS